jgi:hypothetical protein
MAVTKAKVGAKTAKSVKAAAKPAPAKAKVSAAPRVSKSTAVPLTKGMRRVGHLDIPGGGQVYVQGNYAYIGHMKPPLGTSIIDISNPKKPKVVCTIPLETQRSHTHKVRVAGDIMITNVEQNERHATRAAANLVDAEARLATALGRKPKDTEIAAELHIKPGQLVLAREFLAKPYAEGGFKIWDIANKAEPRLLKYVKTHGFGTHRFDMDANYAYISTEMEGYVGNILVNYDLKDPANPEEVSRWWMPGQHIAGGEKPAWKGYKNRLHHALRHKDELWAAVWNAGIRVLDVKDIRNPKVIGAYDYHPPFPEPTHTILKVPFPVAGRDIAVGADEEHDHTYGQLHAGLWVFDVAKRDEIKALSMFHVPERMSPFSQIGRFGMHQFQENLTDTRLYCAWFSGGIRVVDIKNPEAPEETGWFIPEPCGGMKAPATNDVTVDSRGLVLALDRDYGLDILEPAGG